MSGASVELQSALEGLNHRLATESLPTQIEQQTLVEITRIHGELLKECLDSGFKVKVKSISWDTVESVKKKLASNALLSQDGESSLLEEKCLDFAIAAKRSNQMEQCAIAHILRMEINQAYAWMDAVRLIGYQKLGGAFSIRHDLPNSGVFQVDDGGYATEWAEDIAEKVRDLFDSANFTSSACRSYMKCIITDDSPDRLLDANCFFRHRWDVGGEPKTILDVLVRLFLFGIALDGDTIQDVIGKESWDVLHEASLLFHHPSSPSLFVGLVQIYPIAPSDFAALDDECCWFITDWPMESLRLTRDAIMPIGYDTLELMSLTAAGSSGGKLLDLCCGCGVQGIFAYIAGRYEELICTDINQRAPRYVAANLCLNEVSGKILKGDLFHKGLENERFSQILSNPPFVALPQPLQSVYTQPALYSIAGLDGTDLLKRIVRDVHNYLDPDGRLLMVTELPNIEDSCQLLQSYSDERFNVRVAYVEADVEDVETYGNAREMELSQPLHQNDDWNKEQLASAIRNRALALVLMAKDSTQRSSLHKFVAPDSNKVKTFEVESEEPKAEEDDEEDAFLTKQGIHFTRSNLIFNR